MTDIVEPYIPTPRQLTAHRNPARYKLYGGAMGGGKSVWLCESAVRGCLRWPNSRWYLARKEHKTFKRTTYLTLDRVLARDGAIKDHNKSESVYYLTNGSQLWYGGLGTQDDREKIKSMELSGFGIDEASEIEEEFFLMLCTRLRLRVPAAPDGKPCRYQGLLASNPEPGWLYNRFIANTYPDHAFIPALPRDNPHLSADYETGLRQLFSGTPQWTKAYLEGDWDAFSGVRNIIKYADVLAAEVREIDPQGDEVIACDVARFGDDSTTIGHRIGPVVDVADEYAKEDTMQTVGRIVAMYRQHPNTRSINVDVGGVGGGVVDRLREVLRGEPVAVNEINFGAAAMDTEHYANWASEMLAGNLAGRFASGDISIPPIPRLRAELTARLYEFTSRGQVKIESKDDMKKRGLKSPDMADMLMLLFDTGTTIPIINSPRRNQT